MPDFLENLVSKYKTQEKNDYLTTLDDKYNKQPEDDYLGSIISKYEVKPIEPSPEVPEVSEKPFEPLNILKQSYLIPQLKTTEIAEGYKRYQEYENLKNQLPVGSPSEENYRNRRKIIEEYQEIKPDWLKKAEKEKKFLGFNIKEAEGLEREWYATTRLVGELEKKGRALGGMLGRGLLPIAEILGKEGMKTDLQERVAILEEPLLWESTFGNTPAVKAEKARAYKAMQSYDKGAWRGLANDLVESGVDTAITLSILRAFGVFKGGAPTTGVAGMGKGRFLLEGLKRAPQTGLMFSAMTPGDAEQRVKTFGYGTAYNITPYLVPFTGIKGLPAIIPDSLMNIAITSPQYLEIIKNAPDKVEAIRQSIPLLLYDIGFALRTRGLPRDYIRDVSIRNAKVQLGIRPPETPSRYAEKILKMQDEVDRLEKEGKIPPVRAEEPPIREEIPPVKTEPLAVKGKEPTKIEGILERQKVKTIPTQKRLEVFPEKAQLLIQIQDAIKKAPEISVNEKTPKLTFQIDGGANIYNTKQSLQSFYDKISKAPKFAPQITEKGITMPRSIAGKQEEFEPLIKTPKGYVSDGQILFKGETPVGRGIVITEREVSLEAINKQLNTKTQPANLQYYAVKGKEIEGTSETPLPKIKDDYYAITSAVFKTQDGRYVEYNQFKFNAIKNRFPNANYGVTDDGILIAYVNKEPIGAITPIVRETLTNEIKGTVVFQPTPPYKGIEPVGTEGAKPTETMPKEEIKTKTPITETIDKLYDQKLAEAKEKSQKGAISLQYAPKVPFREPIEHLASMTNKFFSDMKDGAIRLITDYPEIRENRPQLYNDLRTGFKPISEIVRVERGKIAVDIWGGLSPKEKEYSVEVIYAKDAIGRIQADKTTVYQDLAREELGKNVSEDVIKAKSIELAQNHLENLLRTIDQDSRLRTDKINESITNYDTISRSFTDSLVEEGILDKDQTIQDYAPHFVDTYTKNWHLYNYLPKKAKAPFRRYTKKAVGSTQPIIKDERAMLANFGQILLDNQVDHFFKTQLSKYDAKNTFSSDKLIDTFGSKLAFGKYEVPNLPSKPGRIVKIDGKEYMVYDYKRNYYRVPYERELASGELKEYEAMAMGKATTYLVPRDVAELMGKLRETTGYNRYLTWVNKAVGMWKGFVLNVAVPVSYNINNAVGDSLMLGLFHPKAFSKVPNSLNFLLTKPQNYNAKQKELSQFIESERVLEAGFMGWGKVQGEVITPHLLRGLLGISQFREAILRTALADSLLTEYKSTNKVPDSFIRTEGLDDRSALGKISRETLIDYAESSRDFDKWIRGAWAPFAKFYTEAPKLITKYAKHKPMVFLGKILTPYIAASLFNRATEKRNEVEEKLPWYFKAKFHLNLNTEDIDGDGNADFATIWSPQIPLDIVPLWGALTYPVVDNAFKVAQGKITFSEASKDIAKQWGMQQYKSALYLTNSALKTGVGLIANQDPIFYYKIVPEGVSRVSKIGLEAQYKYVLENLIPVAGQYMRLERTGEGLTQNWFLDWLLTGPLDVKQAFGFYRVDLSKQEISDVKNTMWAARMKDNELTYYITEHFIDNFKPNMTTDEYFQGLGSDKNILNTAKQNGIDLSEFSKERWEDNTIKNPGTLQLWALNQKRLAKTQIEKNQWDLVIRDIKRYGAEEAFKRLPKTMKGSTLQKLQERQNAIP